MDVNAAVAGLKGKLGLPHQGVNPPAGATPTPASQTPNMPAASPADQIARAQAILSGISDAPTVPTEDATAAALAAKDKAIADMQTRLENIQAASNAQTEQMAALLEKLSPPKTAPKIPVPDLPGLPDGYEDLPADEQVKTVVNAFNSLRDSLSTTLTQDREGLFRALGPLGKQVREMQEFRDKQMVEERYPNFDWDAHKPDVDKIRAELPEATALEAAVLVAHRTDPSLLTIPDARAPVTMDTRPSAPPTQVGTSSQDNIDALQSRVSELRNASVSERLAGRSGAANKLFDEMLKAKLSRKR